MFHGAQRLRGAVAARFGAAAAAALLPAALPAAVAGGMAGHGLDRGVGRKANWFGDRFGMSRGNWKSPFNPKWREAEKRRLKWEEAKAAKACALRHVGQVLTRWDFRVCFARQGSDEDQCWKTELAP